MKRKKNVRLLVDFFNRDYYRAYDEMIDNLRPLLINSQMKPRLIERLDFRSDLPRGIRKAIYMEMARLLSRPGIMARGYCKDDLFLWLSEPEHCNLGVNFRQIKVRVYEQVKSYF